MASYFGFQFTKSLDAETFLLDGYAATGPIGEVLNVASSTSVGVQFDQYGDPYLFPKGISNIAQSASVAGLYTITLEQPWHKLRAIEVTPVCSAVTAGTLKVKRFNVRGSTDLFGCPAKTIELQFEQSGSATALENGGFMILMALKNTNTGR